MHIKRKNGWRLVLFAHRIFYSPLYHPGLGLTSTRGRKWCDWMCPRGSFSDFQNFS
ncbi:MAG: hypothetical protein C0399_01600 [Syntrophus sp. (in: bacteria)]|nr:hypothetical protein [Syntrophus sp. (in: bacteria)]